MNSPLGAWRNGEGALWKQGGVARMLFRSYQLINPLSVCLALFAGELNTRKRAIWVHYKVVAAVVRALLSTRRALSSVLSIAR